MLSSKISINKLNSISLRNDEILVVFNNIGPLNGSTSIGFTFTFSTYTNVTVLTTIATGQYEVVGTFLSANTTAVSNAIVSYGLFTVVLPLQQV